MTANEFIEGWKHFLDCINFSESNLDADAIRFMFESPGEIIKALDFSNDHVVYDQKGGVYD